MTRPAGQRVRLRAAIVYVLLAVPPLALAAAAGWDLWTRTRANEEELAHQTALRALDETLLALVDSETGARGFLLAGEEPFLEPFFDGRRRAAQALSELEAVTAGRAPSEGAARLRQRATRVVDGLREQIAWRRQAPRDAAPPPALLAAGKARMDDARAQVAAMVDAREALLAERLERGDRAIRRSALLLGLATLLVAALIFGAGRRLARSRAERIQAEERREDALAALERSVRQKAESLASLEALYASAPLGLLFVDRELRCLQANPLLLQVAHAKVASVLGRPLREGLPTLAGPIGQMLEGALKGEEHPPTDLDGAAVARPGRRYLAGAYPVRLGGEVIGAGAVLVDATEQVQALERVRESEERLRLATEGAQVAIFELPKEAPRGESLARALGAGGRRVHPDDLPALEEAVGHAAAERARFEQAFRVLTPGGESRWLLARGERRDGKVSGVVVDVTAQRRAIEEQDRLTAALHQSDLRARIILESITDAFFTIDERWRFTYLNAEAERILRRPREALVGRVLWEEFPELEAAPFGRQLREAAEERRTVVFEEPVPARRAWLEVCAYPSDVGLSVYFRDVTERRQRQEEQEFLSEATQRLTSSLELDRTLEAACRVAVPRFADWSAVHLVDDDAGLTRRVALAGPSPERELRYRERARAVWKTSDLALPLREGHSLLIERLAPGQAGTFFQRADDAAAVTELGLTSLVWVPLFARGRRIGSLAYAAAGTRQYTARDLALAEEVARRTAIAVDNARLYREAREAIRVRDEFLSVAAHELRTPLTASRLHVDGVLRAARRGQVDAERLVQKMEHSRRQLGRLGELVDDLLDLSRITAGRLTLHPELADLREIAEEVVERFRGELANAGDLVRVEAEGPVVGAWDRLRLEQVLTNLLSNALKYGERRPVVVRVGAGDGNRAVLEVVDRGIGIRPEDQARLFRRFERAVSYRQYSGFGLGLWIVGQIVDAMGGEIHVRSAPGEGSTFTVSVPRSPAVETTISPEEGPSPGEMH